MPVIPKAKLNNGMEMPVFGLGTFASKQNEGVIAIKHAIDVGYRHLDTALFYENEAEVGRAVNEKIAEGVVKREDMFIVTKLWNTYHEPKLVEHGCRLSLANLNLDYIDLFLMHSPISAPYTDDKNILPKNEAGEWIVSDVDYLDTWKAMEKLVKLGLVRSIGVSNFNSQQLERILQNCEIKPVTNQIEAHPALNQKKLIKFCKARGVTITAYSPLGHPSSTNKMLNFLNDDKIKAIGDKYGKTGAQVILRYLIELGAMPIPKSANKDRIEQNINIFDFHLSEDDKNILDSFNTGERIVSFSFIDKKDHKYNPFNIEY